MLARINVSGTHRISLVTRSMTTWAPQFAAFDNTYIGPQIKTFNSHCKPVAYMVPIAPENDILNEPSISSASSKFIRSYGGRLTNAILDKLPATYYDPAFHQIIDVRVHRFPASLVTTPGITLWPGIPGMHCDGDFRLNYFSQPDLNKAPLCDHYAATIASIAGISNTRFASGRIPVNVESADKHFTVWEQVDKQVYAAEELTFNSIKDGEITHFNSESLHEAMPVAFPGSRLFFRAINYHRPGLGQGYISTKDQLYTLFQSPYLLKTSGKSIGLETHPSYKLLDKVTAHYRIEDLAKEVGFLNADIDYAQDHGGPILQGLINKVPRAYHSHLKIDFLVYRLNPGESPNIPGYDQMIRFPGWHLPLAVNDVSTATIFPEIIASVSTHPEGVNQTRLQTSPLILNVPHHANPYHFWANADQSIQRAAIQKTSVADGEVVLTSNRTLRQETPTTNRGWRGFFRARMDYPQGFITKEQQHVKTNNPTHKNKQVEQLYVSVAYRNKGY